jgi:hypothetical protein
MTNLPARGAAPDAARLLPSPPDPRCAFCLTLAALPWPVDDAPLRLCPLHARLARHLQCRGWNQTVAHQAQAGRARAATFTPEHQRRAGYASFAACSARWRAVQGFAPLRAEDARYLRPEHIQYLGQPLPLEVRTRILAAWQAGDLRDVSSWCSPAIA